MSLRTRIRGFTAWVNMRLMPYRELLNNVLMDLLTGMNMKVLIESITGRDLKKLESFDGLTQQQKHTRFDWIIEELKKCRVIAKDVTVDSRLCAMRNADHVFQLLWRLISHDIWFVWERAEYLQHDNDDILTQVPFRWTPDPPPVPKKKASKKTALLAGFGSASAVDDPETTEQVDTVTVNSDLWVKFPREDFMKKFKTELRDIDSFPSPENCIVQLVNAQLKTIDDLVDSRVLCAMVNSFVPNTFNTELLLNDRWTINLALQTAEEMFHTETPYDSEDLVEADTMAVCAYFCFFFMSAYKFRQCRAVVRRIDWLHQLVRECNHELDRFPAIVSNLQELHLRKELKAQSDLHREAISRLEKRFDVDMCRNWVTHVAGVQTKVRVNVREKMNGRFESIVIPRNITVNDVCLSMVINLHLTNGTAFVQSDGSREVLTEGRRVVLKDRNTEEFIEDFTGKSKESVKKLLKLSMYGFCEVNPLKYPQYEFFFECQSRNKQLKAGTILVYQIFPGSTYTWQRMFLKMAKENDFDNVEKMVTFFQDHSTFINCKEPKTMNTALHLACRYGHMEIASYLLENGANIDAKNSFKCTPLHSAIEGLHRDLCHLLIEWGCDVHATNIKDQTPIETVKNEDFKVFLAELYNHYSMIVPRIMEGDKTLLEDTINAHKAGLLRYASLHSRCINGSTLLHTAAYYGQLDVVKELIQLRVNVNLPDYKKAAPIHRARDADTLRALLNAGGDVNAEDCEGNTPLHVKCYGETGKPSELECIELLLDQGASYSKRNNRGLLPVHCCAMQGRIDVMRLMLHYDENEEIVRSLNTEDKKQPPSVLHLALANDFVDCAAWLVESGFRFKDKESDLLLRRILTEQIRVSNRINVINFLLSNGAEANPIYPGGNTCLHYAATLSGGTEVLEMLLSYGAEVDAQNDEGDTPLFFAAQCNNQFAACVLLAHGSNVRLKNAQGLTAFDHVVDFEEWVESGYFADDIKSRLKAYSLKHTRDLIRAISKKVKGNVCHARYDRPKSGLQLQHTPMIQSQTVLALPASVPTGGSTLWSTRSTTSSALWQTGQHPSTHLPPLKSAESTV